jgi:hypothetical protein
MKQQDNSSTSKAKNSTLKALNNSEKEEIPANEF